MTENRNIGLFIFFTTLLFIKVSAFHAYSHMDDDCDHIENCKYCELAIENQNVEHIVPLPCVLYGSNLVFFQTKLNYNSHISIISKSFVAKNYCRPPPSIVWAP